MNGRSAWRRLLIVGEAAGSGGLILVPVKGVFAFRAERCLVVKRQHRNPALLLSLLPLALLLVVVGEMTMEKQRLKFGEHIFILY
jgi:hypothetical protein